jgi:hypothetical protein
MSVKFKESVTETVKTAAQDIPLPGGKVEAKDLAHEVGQALTKGGGANGYLAVSQRGRSRQDRAMLMRVSSK